jgi:hypothetical protein
VFSELEVEIVAKRIEDKLAALKQADEALRRRIAVTKEHARQLEALTKLETGLDAEIRQLLDAAEWAPIGTGRGTMEVR